MTLFCELLKYDKSKIYVLIGDISRNCYEDGIIIVTSLGFRNQLFQVLNRIARYEK